MAIAIAEAELDVNNSVFLEARKQFLGSISDQEAVQFSKCPSAAELLADIEWVKAGIKDKRLDGRIFASIRSFVNHLQHYFDVLGITVESHPEWTAIAFGAFRLVLQLASNYTTFLMRLAEMLDSLQKEIPRYQDIPRFTRHQATNRFHTSLRNLYVDLFEFFKVVAQVFTKKSGKVKRTHVVSQLLWQPFDVRFQNIMKRIAIHQETFRNEMALFKLREEVESYRTKVQKPESTENSRKNMLEYRKLALDLKEMERAHADASQKNLMAYNKLAAEMNRALSSAELDSTCDRIKRWLNPPEYMEELKEAQSLRHEGTGGWLVKEAKYEEWKVTVPLIESVVSSQNVLWITGSPGTGKTILAGSAIMELSTRCSAEQAEEQVVAYFFFNQSVPKKDQQSSAYRSILAQIFQQCRSDEAVLNSFTYAMSIGTRERLVDSTETLLDLIRVTAKYLKDAYIVLDAVDECSEAEVFAGRILECVFHSPVKLLIFSRPNVGILREKIGDKRSISISSQLINQDIEIYCTTGVEKLFLDGLLPPSGPSVKELVAKLLFGAAGMFLWPRLMFCYLQSPMLSPRTRLRAIQDLKYPEQLDQMYCRILSLIAMLPAHERNLARRTFICLRYLKSHISAQQLQDLLFTADLDPSARKETMLQGNHTAKFPVFNNTLIMVCESLVELCTHGGVPNLFYRFIHGSANEFFTRSAYPNQPPELDPFISQELLIVESEAETELTSECIGYLMFRTPAQPLSGSMLQGACKMEVEIFFPFLSYASCYWSHHLEASVNKATRALVSRQERTATMLRSMLKFLSLKFVLMAWIESLYLFRVYSLERQEIYSKLLGWVNGSNAPGFCIGEEFMDIPTLLKAFVEDIMAMDELWGDTLSISPEEIWNDVTAFTPSPFFVQTTAVSVESLTPKKPECVSQSDVPLCTISAEAADGVELGVLSIWPSKSFEKSWRNTSSKDYSGALAQACGGWIAQYEIWDIGKEESKFLHGYRIPIDEKEVWLQVRHFLRRTLFAGGRTSKGLPQTRLELQFPVTINAKNINMLVILRTIYVVKRVSISTWESNSRAWQFFIMPLDFTDALRSIWPADETVARLGGMNDPHQSGPKMSPAKYVYNFQFSENNHYLLYQDTMGMDLLPDGQQAATSLAVFELQLSGSKPAVSLFGYAEIDSSFDYFLGCTIHPELPLLSSIACSFTGVSKIVLWNFDPQESGHSYSEICPVIRRVELLNFSSCGQNLVVKYLGSSRPDVYSIVQNDVYKHAASIFKSIPKDQHTQLSKQVPARNSLLSQSPFSMARQGRMQMFQNAQGSVQHQRAVFFSKGPTRSIELIRADDEVEESQPLLSLPRWEEIDQVNVSVHAPRTRKEKITIILNKAAQPSYSLSDPVDQHFPAVVKKDQRAGKYEEGEAMHRRALEGREKVLGLEHPDTLTSMNNLVFVLRGQGHQDQAISLMEECF